MALEIEKYKYLLSFVVPHLISYSRSNFFLKTNIYIYTIKACTYSFFVCIIYNTIYPCRTCCILSYSTLLSRPRARVFTFTHTPYTFQKAYLYVYSHSLNFHAHHFLSRKKTKGSFFYYVILFILVVLSHCHYFSPQGKKYGNGQ